MPRPAKIKRDEVLHAALLQLDAGGVDALSMRALGKSLGVEAMSLYKHVGKRDELLCELLERFFRSVPLPESSGNWRRDLEVLCTELWRVLSARPSARALLCGGAAGFRWSASSLPIGEAMMSALAHPIPEELDRAYAFHALFSFVLGQSVFGADQTMNWRSLPAGEYPALASASGTLDARSPEVEFELGLRALLDGVERRSPF